MGKGPRWERAWHGRARAQRLRQLVSEPWGDGAGGLDRGQITGDSAVAREFVFILTVVETREGFSTGKGGAPICVFKVSDGWGARVAPESNEEAASETGVGQGVAMGWGS